MRVRQNAVLSHNVSGVRSQVSVIDDAGVNLKEGLKEGAVVAVIDAVKEMLHVRNVAYDTDHLRIGHDFLFQGNAR